MNLKSIILWKVLAFSILLFPQSGSAEPQRESSEEFCNRWNNVSPTPRSQDFANWGNIFPWSRFISRKQNHCTEIEIRNCYEGLKTCTHIFYYKTPNGIDMSISEAWVNDNKLIRTIVERKICAFKKINTERICLNFDNLEEKFETKQSKEVWETKKIINAGQYDKNLDLQGQPGRNCNPKKLSMRECDYVRAEEKRYNHIISEASK